MIEPKAIKSFTALIDILAASVDLATTDVTGQVTHGFIRLIGTLIAASMEPQTETGPEGRLVHPLFVIDLKFLQHKRAHLSRDFDLETKCGLAGLFFLPVMTTSDRGLVGLFLELVDPINQLYERLGLLEISDYYVESDDGSDDIWKETFKERVLTLI